MHPSEDCIATGTNVGQIIIWYNYLQAMKQQTNDENNNSQLNKHSSPIKPTKTKLHWHSLPVLTLCFTQEGSFLLSGGHECVLVKWMFKTAQKDFRPRLGAPLSELSCSTDNTLVATRHLDNSIHLISQGSTTLSVVRTFSSFICANFSSSKNLQRTFYPCGLSYFKYLNCLVTNGKPGHLQFYSFNAEKLIFNVGK